MLAAGIAAQVGSSQAHCPSLCRTPCTQVCINIGILAAYCIGVAYEAGVDTVELLGRPVEWWCAAGRPAGVCMRIPAPHGLGRWERGPWQRWAAAAGHIAPAAAAAAAAAVGRGVLACQPHPHFRPPRRRIMFATAAGPALLQSAAMALCPESPAWLLRAARPSDAVAALRRLHGTRLRLSDYPKLEAAYVGPLEAVPPPAGADTQQPLLAAEHGGAAEGGGEDGGVGAGAAAAGWASLWEPRYRRVMVLAAALPLTQQASGINTVIFYSSQACVGSVVWDVDQLGGLVPGRHVLLRRVEPPLLPCRPPCCPQVFEQAGLRSPVLGSILMGLANLGGCLRGGGGQWPRATGPLLLLRGGGERRLWAAGPLLLLRRRLPRTPQLREGPGLHVLPPANRRSPPRPACLQPPRPQPAAAPQPSRWWRRR